MAIEGIASYAASMVRDGLSRLISRDSGDGDPDQGGEKSSSSGTPLLLAVAVAAVVTVLLVGRKAAKD